MLRRDDGWHPVCSDISLSPQAQPPVSRLRPATFIMNLMPGRHMEFEIREQPETLRNGASTYFPFLAERLAGQDVDLVLLAARGSSDNAALFARYLIEVHLGIPVVLAAPSVWTRFQARPRYPRTLAIGISQSGMAPDVAAVLEAMRADGHSTLAITNVADSRLADTAQHTLLLNTGREHSVAATKTFTATLLALYETVRALGGTKSLPEPVDLPDDSYVQECFDLVPNIAGPLVRGNPLFMLGRGYTFSTAQEAALKLMECALLPAKPYSSADFEHGPKALAGPGSAAVVFEGNADVLRHYGCDVIEPPKLTVTEELLPFWLTVFAQVTALHCSRVRGLNPDDPRFLRKVTQTL